jgi:hypothetical protein
MKKSILVMLVSSICILWTYSGMAQDQMSYSGEVLDLSCYLKSGAKGPDHASCAKSCVKSGQPMGLLTKDGKVMLLASGEDKAKIETLKDLAGEMVEVKGTVSERDGISMLIVADAKKSGS